MLGAARARFAKLWAKYRRVALKLLLDAIVPSSAAVLWGGITYFHLGKVEFADVSNAASLSFLLVLSFQNLFQRANKVIRDDEHGRTVLGRLDLIDQSFDSLQEGLGALRKHGLAKSKRAAGKSKKRGRGRVKAATVSSSSSGRLRYKSADIKQFFAPAEQAVELGQLFGGVLQASVGLENAVRSVLRRHKIDDRRQSMGMMLRELTTRGMLEKKSVEFLMTLNRMRNGLVHGERAGSSITKAEARDLVYAFLAGANLIERLGRGPFDQTL